MFSGINPLAKKILGQLLLQNNKEVLDINKIAQDFLQSKLATNSTSEGALTAYLITSNFPDSLKKDVLDKLFNIINNSFTKGGFIKDIFQKIEVLRSEVKGYFLIKVVPPYSYIKLEPVAGSKLGNLILELECHKVAAQSAIDYRMQYPDGFIATAFIHKMRPGVWMSKKGIPYDSNKI